MLAECLLYTRFVGVSVELANTERWRLQTMRVSKKPFQRALPYDVKRGRAPELVSGECEKAEKEV